MLAHIEDLLILQEKDLRLQKLRQELDRTPKEQEAARQRLQNTVNAMEQAKSALQENEVAIKALELDIRTRRDTISRLKTQQFETKKNEEYTKLGQEIVRYEGDIDGLETSELELMEKSDQLQKTLSEAQKDHETVNHGVEEEISALQSRADTFQKELEGLEADRAAKINEIPDSMAAHYERLLKSRGAPVVSLVTPEGLCTGCHVKVTPSTLVNVRAAKELISCANCGRILYSE